MTDDWCEALAALSAAGARFIVVGAHALAVLTGISESASSRWPGTRGSNEVAESKLPFLGRDTLIENKRASGRLKYLADIEALGEKP